MRFDSKFDLGEIVYLRAGEMKGMVTAITFMPGAACYTVTWEDASSSEHFGMELTNDKNDRYGA